MPDYAAGFISKNGIEVPIVVDDSGRWKAEHGGRYLSAETREKLADQIGRETRKTTVKVAVDFVQIDVLYDGRIKFLRTTATGFHSANGNLLTTRTDPRGKIHKEQLTRAHSSGSWYVFGDVDNDVLGELADLSQARHEAVQAFTTFVNKHKIDVRAEVEKAIEVQQNGSEAQTD